jgi:hypothetical protein
MTTLLDRGFRRAELRRFDPVYLVVLAVQSHHPRNRPATFGDRERQVASGKHEASAQPVHDKAKSGGPLMIDLPL